MHSFEINGKRYNSVPIDLNTICTLEEMGVPIDSIDKMQFSYVRAYFAICARMSIEEAGQELESHMIAGGNWDGLVEVMNLEREESNFFRTLMQRAEESNAEKTEEKSEKKK